MDIGKVVVMCLLIAGCGGGSHNHTGKGGGGWEPLPSRNLNITTQCDQGVCRDMTVDYYNKRGIY